MSALKYKHLFTITGGKFIWESKEMLDFIRRDFEGKKGYAQFVEVKEGNTVDQYGYYFAGIIREACMTSNAFAGNTEYEVHCALMMETGHSHTSTFEHPKHGRIIYEVPQDIKKFGKKKMAAYVDQVIALLNSEYQIHPMPSKYFKDNKYYMDPKTYK